MVTQIPSPIQEAVIYPDSDGLPIANNTDQFRWILVIEQNLEWMYADDENVFVAGDLFWYPIEGRSNIVNAPDVMVAFGIPKGRRSSYQQWNESGIAPQVVFEILSPSNTQDEMEKKLLFYDRHGVEEYYSTFQVSEVHNRGRDTAVPCPYGNRRAIGVYFINVESAVYLQSYQ